MTPDHAPTAGTGEFTVAGPTREDFRRYAHRWLLVIPFIWQIALVPFVNTASVRVFSLPLPMAWQMVGILIATSLIALVFRIDRRIERADEATHSLAPVLAPAEPEPRS